MSKAVGLRRYRVRRCHHRSTSSLHASLTGLDPPGPSDPLTAPCERLTRRVSAVRARCERHSDAAPMQSTKESNMQYAIEAEGLTKRFGDTQALDGVDLAVAAGHRARRARAQRRRQDHRRPHPRHAAAGRRRHAPASRGYDVVTRRRSRSAEPIGLTGQYASVDEDLTGTPEPGHDRPAARPGSRATPRPAPPSCSSWFDLTDAADRPAPRPTPAACAAGSTWPRASSAGPR